MIHLRKGHPIFHIIRDGLPWRDEGPMTECGRRRQPHLMTWDDFLLKTPLLERREIPDGALTCQTCAECTGPYVLGGPKRQRWSWKINPTAVVRRYTPSNQYDADTMSNIEYWAIADLIAAHRDEFEVRKWEISKRAKP